MEKCFILSLSGGGYKGLYTAKILQGLEQRLGFPLGRKFDMLSGTSIGGIIAICLALEIPTEQIVDIFTERGQLIFGQPRGISWVSYTKYEDRELKKCLTELFGDKKIGDLKHRLLIPIFNYTTGKPQVLKTRHNEKFSKDIEWSLVDAALATSAAPTYFPFFRRNNGDFIDGGVVANNPSVFACIEAYRYLEMQFENIFQLHIGTTIENMSSSGLDEGRKTGLKHWASKIISLLFNCQEQSSTNMLKLLLEDRCYIINSMLNTLQQKIVKLDNISKDSSRLLSHHAEAELKDFLGTDFFKILLDYSAPEFDKIPLQGMTK